MVLGAGLCVWGARRHWGRGMVVVTRAVALLIVAAWAGEYIADALTGIWSARYDLPLQLTDAASVVSALALWTQRPRLVELCYLWAMTASLQAILTPDLGYSFPSVFYFTYFIYHDGAVIGACLLVFGRRIELRRGALRRVYLTTLGWACLAGLGDVVTGGNYMFLREKPEHSSLLSALGPWPWYIVITAILIAPALLALATGLAKLVQRWDQPRKPPASRPPASSLS